MTPRPATRDTARPMDKPTWLAAALAGMVLTACAQPPAAPGCGWQVVPMAPVAPREFAGRVGTTEIRLHSERDSPDVESFPDSALKIGSPSGHCAAEGGVWQRRGIHVSADGRTVAAIESSGSNDMLAFFDTASCRRAGEIDVSNARWRFVDRGVEITPVGGAARTRALGADCRPPARR